jgi:glycosyltransferase involved in cell wall biosynthesis
VTFFYDEIYDKIRHELPQVSFTIIGRNPPDRIIQLESLDSSVSVTGTVKDIRPFVAESQVAVVPLRMGSGTRLKILEAMAMRKPVVSTSIGAEGLDVTNDKDILIADNPKEFATKVIELLTDEGLRTRIVNNAFNLIRKEYDIGVVKEKLREVFAHQSEPHL